MMMIEKFRVQWEVIDYDAYEFATQHCKEDFPKIKDFIDTFTGTVYGIIPAKLFTSTKFLVCLDKSNEFVEVNVDICKRIN